MLFYKSFQIRVWVNDEQVGSYEVGEEVWDLLVKDNLLFTVRNIDVSVTEMIPGTFVIVHSIFCLPFVHSRIS